MTPLLKASLYGLVCGFIGWPCFLFVAQLLDALATNALPPLVHSLAPGVTGLLPGLVYVVARCTEKSWQVALGSVIGVALGVLLPVALVLTVLSLLGPLPHG